MQQMDLIREIPQKVRSENACLRCYYRDGMTWEAVAANMNSRYSQSPDISEKTAAESVMTDILKKCGIKCSKSPDKSA